jgi:hypothetical protein
MRKNVTRAGILTSAGLGAVALTITGFALPASAEDGTTSTSSDETTASVSALESLDAAQFWIDEVLALYGNDTAAGNVGDTTAGNFGIDGGLVNAPLVEGPLVSDVANGPIASGNDAPVLSGNDVDASVGSGNEVGSGNAVGSGNDSGVSVGDIGADLGGLTSDIGADVDGMVGDISSDVDDLVTGILD